MKNLKGAIKDALAWPVDFVREHKAYSTFVLLPMILTATYYAFICSDRYVSEAAIVVEKESTSSAPSIALSLLGVGGSSSTLDAQLIIKFIKSPAMLNYLEEQLHLREHYTSDSIDWLSRLSPKASEEDFLAFYLRRIRAELDEESMTIDLAIQADSREFSQLLAQTIVRRSEQFVNEISQSLAREQIAFAQGELEALYTKVQQSSADLIETQNKKGVLSAEAENASITQIIAALQQELARERTTLKTLSAYLSDTAAEVVAAKKRIAAITQQIAQERSKQVGAGSDNKLNQQMLDFREVTLAAQISLDIYQTGLRTLETARIDATRKVKYLVSVSAPTLPDESKQPRRLYIVLTTFLVLNLVYGIGGLIVATIKDHRE